jgi:DNA-binding HxlR family transcriptional regulator
MAAFDLLGRRWMLRIVGDLGHQAMGFNELQRTIGQVSTSVLSTRLRELGDSGLVATDAAGRYQLTELGRSLLLALTPLFVWSDQWADASGQPRNELPPQYR